MRRLAIGGLGLAVLVAILFLVLHRPFRREAGSTRADSSQEERSADRAASLTTWDGGAIGRTIADRRVRDALRKRIFDGWAADPASNLPPSPTSFPARPPEGTAMDPKYIQDVMRSDLMPMASKCYEELLVRQPDAGGRVMMTFKIVGDDALGGIVEDADIDDTEPEAIHDEKLATCIRESLSTLAFPPPAKDGWVTVGYPIVFQP